KAAGKRVILGVRPEDIYDSEFVAPGITPAPVETRVDVTELMGNEIFLYLQTGQHEFIARVDPRSKAHVGQQMQVIMNADNMHLFDAETEQAIRGRPAIRKGSAPAKRGGRGLDSGGGEPASWPVAVGSG